MLKILTDLSDEEIAKLKFHRRLLWHKTIYYPYYNATNPEITDKELRERGIEPPQDDFIEYEKRPPHDKYL